MCGICGAVALHGPLNPAIRTALPAMMEAIRHRGPDGGGLVDGPHAALGHRRLAIIDRATGAQPMSNEDRTTWVVFNGEIYNHRAVRRTLIDRGHVFRTESDTEVIVHAFEEYGAACVEHLEGMFAFAVYDVRRRELLLARDRLGKKPLFYAIFDDVLHFGSEIKSLRESPAWDGTIDWNGLETYLALGYFLAPSTIYRHVRNLEPGHVLHVRHGRPVMTRYWDITHFDDDPRQGASLIDAVDTGMREAVTRRLESEVPLGAFLSGGIDSGLVVSYMAEASSNPVVTTSVGFGHAEHNELGNAALTARKWQTSHFEEVIEPRLDEVLDVIVDGFDEPFADSSAIPTYYVSAAARRHVTVALSGDGGDESFGGYGFRYVPHAVEDRIRTMLPPPARRLAGWAGDRWPRGAHVPRLLRWRTNLQNLRADSAESYYADLCFLKPPEVRRLLGTPVLRDVRETGSYDAVTSAYRRCPSADPIQRAEYADVQIYLPNDVLAKVDRMSMAHSLEVRCPLLDHRVVELAFRIPRRRKLPHLEPKGLLRQVARGRIPDTLLRQHKRGFTAPVGEWIAHEYRPLFEEDVFGASAFTPSVVDPRRLREMLNEHSAGRADHSYTLWAVWMLERWAARQNTRVRSPWPPKGHERVRTSTTISEEFVS